MPTYNTPCDYRPAPKQTEKHPPGLIPPTQWGRYYDWPSYPALTNLIRDQRENGYASAFYQVGKNRTLIDPRSFWKITRVKAREWREVTNG